MFRWLRQLLYGSTPASFPSDFAIAESVDRLSRIVRPTHLHTFTREAAVGRVSATRVKLERHIPFVLNPFKIYFYGSFDSDRSLCGRFELELPIRVFMTVWLGLIGTATIVGGTLGLVTGNDPVSTLLFTLGSAGLFATGCGLVWIGKWISRNDATWLSQVIESTLRNRT